MCSGNIADFPAPPINININDQVKTDKPINDTLDQEEEEEGSQEEEEQEGEGEAPHQRAQAYRREREGRVRR